MHPSDARGHGRSELPEARRRRLRRTLLLLAACCLLHAGCVALQARLPEEVALSPAKLRGEEIAFLALFVVPATVGIDLFILPAYFATGDRELFFPVTRAVIRVAVR